MRSLRSGQPNVGDDSRDHNGANSQASSGSAPALEQQQQQTEAYMDKAGFLNILLRFSSPACSKSGKEPFSLELSFTNQLLPPSFMPVWEQSLMIHLTWDLIALYRFSMTDGPIVEVQNIETKAIVAVYRLEICREEDLQKLIARSNGIYQLRNEFHEVLAGRSVRSWKVLNQNKYALSDWCRDLMQALQVGKHYQFKIGRR